MKQFITLALPVVALTFTSCGNSPRTVNYQQMRRFASENYDSHAIDTVPTDYMINFNNMTTNVVVEYNTPAGGFDSFTFSYGFGNVHIRLKDRYAITLSSTVIDSIEKYYSDFVAIALTLKDEPPVELLYQLFGNNCSKIDLVTSHKLVGDVLVRLLQFAVGAIDGLSAITGYMPLGEMPTDPLRAMVYRYVMMALEAIPIRALDPSMFFGLMDYVSLTISDSSKSHGDVFETYVTTDNYGFLNKLDFNFKSSFEIAGLAAFKRYENAYPEEGERPISTEAPYNFTLTGSFDYDFDISTVPSIA